MLLKPFMDLENYTTSTAALEIIKRKKYDIVFMDLKMPVMDGYEAARQIKILNPSIPVIAQTAYALSNDEEKALQAGCDDFITKPYKGEQIFNLINKWVKKV